MIPPGRRLLRRPGAPRPGADDDRVIVLPDARGGNGDAGADPRPEEAASALVRQFGWSGFVGSVLLGLGAYGAGWVSLASGIATLPVLETIRTHPPLTFACRLAVIIGAAILLQAWLRLGHQIRTRRVTAPRALRRLGLWWGAPLFLSPVLFSRDVYSYIAQSRLLPHGIDPYQYGTGVFDTFYTDGADWIWKTAPAPYGPLWMGLSSAVYRLTGAQAVPALAAFRLLAVLGVVLIVIFLPRMARACGVDEAKAIWLGVLNPLVLLHFVTAAHNDALMMGLLVAGMTLALEGRPVVGLVLVSLAGAVKAPGLLGLPFVGLAWAGPGSTFWRRVRMWAASAAVAVLVFVGLNLMTGLGFGWLSSLGTPGKVRTWLSPTTGLGMITGNLLDVLGLGYRVDGAVDAWRGVGALLTIAVLLYLVLTGHHRSPARGLGLALFFLVMLGPVVQPWYLLWGLVVLAGAGLSRGETRAAVLVSTGFTVYSIVNSGATVPTYVFLSDGIVTLISVVVVLGLLAASRRSRTLLLEEAPPTPPRPLVTTPAGGRAAPG